MWKSAYVGVYQLVIKSLSSNNEGPVISGTITDLYELHGNFLMPTFFILAVYVPT